MTTDNTNPPTEETKVIPFAKRYKEKDEPPTAPRLVPMWRILYNVNDTEHREDIVQGYLRFLGTTHAVFPTENAVTDINDAIFIIDAIRIVKMERLVQTTIH